MNNVTVKKHIDGILYKYYIIYILPAYTLKLL